MGTSVNLPPVEHEKQTFVRSDNDSSLQSTTGQRWIFLRGEVNAVISFALFSLQLYTTYIALFGRNFIFPFKTTNVTDGLPATSASEYSTSVLSLIVILFCGVVAGYLLQLIRLPGLLGMLLAGILLRNIPLSGDLMFIVSEWGVVLRRTAFIIILLRGGLSLDADALKRLKGACFRLALIPCTVEAIVVALASSLILGISIPMGLLLGFMLAAVSPAVVVPAMLDAVKKGYGKSTGVTTLVVAAASLDDVYAITLFSLCMTIVFGTGSSIPFTLIRAPVEVISGVVIGTAAGFLFHYFPSRDQANVHLIRLSLLLSFSTAILFGTTALHCDSIGAIAVLICAFVAAYSWKKDGPLPEENQLAIAWNLCFQPFLFGLIGFELSFTMLNWSTVGLGLLVLLIGLTFRTAAASCAVLGSGLCFKQRLFVALAWTPKATVQAALAPVALDLARSTLDTPPDVLQASQLIFCVAVLSILTTAPIGAFLIRFATPRLLSREDTDDSSDNELGMHLKCRTDDQIVEDSVY